MTANTTPPTGSDVGKIFAKTLGDLMAKLSDDLDRSANQATDPATADRKRRGADAAVKLGRILRGEATIEQIKAEETAAKVAANRQAAGRRIIDPFDKNAPIGTVRRRIHAHNALLDVAAPGRDRICGIEEESVRRADITAGPCVLKQGHAAPGYDDNFRRHMDAEQRDRAERYLVHSEPDPERRA